MSNTPNYPYSAVESGYPAWVPIGAFVHTPASSLVVLKFTAQRDIVIEALDVIPGDCGSSGDSTFDITDDGTSIFDSTPTIQNDDTNGTMQRFTPAAAKKTIAAGSAVVLTFGTAATAAANFGFTIHAITHKKID